ncbi:MAG: LamG domain-containing protein, partial [Planctomycetes bacterium]|nr:LamG domain-containing protein [Planctomycetota bacterium]
AVITDGQWHRIAVVWDGTYRMLYVDEKEVARDAVPALELSSVRLVLGGGSNLAPVSFWSGVIDDIRIYSRAVNP